MIIKILSSANNFSGIKYNERKNDVGESELLCAENFGGLSFQTDLVRELKQTANNEESIPLVQAAKKTEGKKKVSISKLDTKSDLKSMINLVNQRNDFELGHAVYIDSEIHDILRQIKSQTRLVVGNLVSSLLEEFILEHKSEIILLFKGKTKRLI